MVPPDSQHLQAARPPLPLLHFMVLPHRPLPLLARHAHRALPPAHLSPPEIRTLLALTSQRALGTRYNVLRQEGCEGCGVQETLCETGEGVCGEGLYGTECVFGERVEFVEHVS